MRVFVWAQRTEREEDEERAGLSIGTGVCVFSHAGTHVLRVILCEVWRAGQTVQRDGQLCNYAIGSGDKWQGRQLKHWYLGSMASVIEVLNERKWKTRSGSYESKEILPPLWCLTKKICYLKKNSLPEAQLKFFITIQPKENSLNGLLSKLSNTCSQVQYLPPKPAADVATYSYSNYRN